VQRGPDIVHGMISSANVHPIPGTWDVFIHLIGRLSPMLAAASEVGESNIG